MAGSKSRPVYPIMRIDPAGRSHLIVTDRNDVPPELEAELPPGRSEIWVVGQDALPPAHRPRVFFSVADLHARLSRRLAQEPIGLRLYALGSEAFLWDAMNLARAAGMAEGEVFLQQAGTLRRRVFCPHCNAMNEDVTTNIVACRGCGARLFVRDHFSRRLAAFMGVQVDAEVPGEVPVLQVLYP